jgi:phage terminase small subunit
MAKLTARQRVFVEEYLICWNASEAARRAGYKGKPNVVGPRLLANVSIQEAIRARVDELSMSANEVLLGLTAQARGTLGDFITIGRRGAIKIDVGKALTAGKLHLVKKLTKGKNGVSIELYDAQAAMVQIGRARGMFIDKTAFTDPTGDREYNPYAGISDVELHGELERLEQKRKRALSAANAGSAAPGPEGTPAPDPGGEADRDPDT